LSEGKIKMSKYFLVIASGDEVYIEAIMKIFNKYNIENDIKTINLKIPNTFIIKDTNNNFTENELCGIYRGLIIKEQLDHLPKLIKTTDILVKQISDSTLLF